MPTLPRAAGEPSRLAVPAVSFAKLQITVVDALGAALPGIVVLAVHESGTTVKGITGGAGLAELICPPGASDVSANRQGDDPLHGQELVPMQLLPGDVASRTITLADATTSLQVVVTDDLGAVLSGVKLTARGPSASRRDGRQATDAQGAARWHPVAAGAWSVRVESGPDAVDWRAAEPLRVTVTAGEQCSVRLVLARTGAIVLDPRSQAGMKELGELHLMGLHLLESRRAPWSSDEIVWHVPAGDYVVTARWLADSRRWSPSVPVSVAAAERREVFLQVQQAGLQLAGIVLDQQGAAVKGVGMRASVRGHMGGGDRLEQARGTLAVKEVVSDAEGRWSIDGLPRGITALVVDTTRTPERYLARYESADRSPYPIEIPDPAREVTVRVSKGVHVRGVAQIPADRADSGRRDEVEVSALRPDGSVAWSRDVPLTDTGSFDLPNVGAGSYTLVLHDDLDWTCEPQLLVIEESAVEGSDVTVSVGDG
ncbi:MAG TPA: carboxypeptidase-like regulatory domain-containing protein [Planctomycetota bacterium]|nr:carboxypeptidase-like regulatory domain-containing protein [Planctomycetota bacterium]